MVENLPKKGTREFEIDDEKLNELKTVAAVTKIMSEDRQLTKEIAEIFIDVEKKKERELVERVTKALAEKVTDVKPEEIKAAFSYWYLASGQFVHIRPMGPFVH
jgi:acetolactate synthase small subunit